MNGFNYEPHDQSAVDSRRQNYKGMHRGTVLGKTFERSRKNRKKYSTNHGKA